VLGFISYVLILIFFPPTPVLNRKPLDLTGTPKWQLPPAWNSLRISLLSLIGLVMVFLVAPILLTAFVGYSVLKSARPE
jgi:hypothetical protein